MGIFAAAELFVQMRIKSVAFFTESCKETPFKASAAMIAEKISPVPGRDGPPAFVE